MTTAISVAVREGAQAVVCASTGNTSASMAAYAARAGIKPLVLVPQGKIATGKMTQAILHGAQIIMVRGNFDHCLEMAKGLSWDYPVSLVNSVNPVRLQGQKTAAFEIVDQLGDAPDFHLLPVGNAGNISAYWMGYTQYADLGRATKKPVMRGFQAEGAAPLVTGEPFPDPETRATAIRVGNPASWKLAEAARNESGGRFAAVSDGADPRCPAPARGPGRRLRRARLGRGDRRPAPGPRSWGELRRPHRRGHRDRPRAQGHRHRARGLRQRRRQRGRRRRGRRGPGRRARPRCPPSTTERCGSRSPRPPPTSVPGFDSLGLALDLRDELAGEVTESGLQVEVRGFGADDVPRDESNLVVRAMRAAFAAMDVSPPGLRLSCDNAIPHGRGLGSSAAAIVGGAALARALVDGRGDPPRRRLPVPACGRDRGTSRQRRPGAPGRLRHLRAGGRQLLRPPLHRRLADQRRRVRPAGPGLHRCRPRPAAGPGVARRRRGRRREDRPARRRARPRGPSTCSWPRATSCTRTSAGRRCPTRWPWWTACGLNGVAATVSGAGPTVLAFTTARHTAPDLAERCPPTWECRHLEIDRVGVRVG